MLKYWKEVLLCLLLVFVVLLYNGKKHLEEQLSTANQTNVEISKLLKQTTADNTGSLSALNKKVEYALGLIGETKAIAKKIKDAKEVSVGSGVVTLNNSATIASSNFVYSDAWQTIEVSGNRLSYIWEFKIGDVGITEIDENNIQKNYYAVYLEGKDGSRKVINYERKFTHLIDKGIKWDPKLQIGLSYYKGLEGSLLFSPWAYHRGTIKGNNLIVFPQFSIQSNFRESLGFGIGLGFNVGAYLPLLNDLFISPHYVFGEGAVICISTTI